MGAANLYRCVLLLYPPEFRQQFSEEMLSVFEQRSGEHFANRRLMSFAFLLKEFFGAVKGAYVMWLSKVRPIHHKRLQPAAAVGAAATPTAAEVTMRHQTAIKNMVKAIAEHDFVNARRYSDEEARLKSLLQGLKDGGLAAKHKLA
jgi:hypothetical protein